ncbi:hypothetical protein M413DRAFT_440621 [Hebeloma cylindrosporum]|uniref:Cytochrome P450 n=1 Tax=Hebeloma cylindrosporum TaxID=76867 RepID=A0A0C3CEA1_HEBCY|nr:hypothetical protein M413DRAFT_440621 [Hebeloma cylindrosporum h7]
MNTYIAFLEDFPLKHHSSTIKLAALTFLLISFALLYTRRAATPRLKGPPSRSFLFGATRDLFEASDPSVIYQDWEKLYGAIYQVPTSLGARMIVLSDPKALAQFFAKDTSTYQQPLFSRLTSRRLLGDILLVMEGDIHKRQRRATAPAFSVAAIRSITPVFLDHAHKVSASWNSSLKLASGKAQSAVIDVQQWMTFVSLDSIGKGGFSHDFESLDGKTSPIMEGLNSFGSAKPSFSVMLAFLVGPRLPWLFTKIPNTRWKRFSTVTKAVKDIAGQLLEKAAKEKELLGAEVNKSIIGTLLRAQTASSSVQMSIDEIVAQVNSLMIAGYESMSITLTWGLIELARHPDVHAKLRAELRHNLGDQDPTYDQLAHELPYLDAFTSEVLRLRPASAEMTRVAMEDNVLPLTEPIATASGTYIDSLFIEKGMTIRVPVAGVNRSEALWGSDANEFNPERWLIVDSTDRTLKAKRETVQGYRNLLTFALGPRVCIGKSFSVAEFKAVMSIIARDFTFEFPGGPDTKIGSHRSVLMRPKVEGEEEPRVPLIVRRATPMG